MDSLCKRLAACIRREPVVLSSGRRSDVYVDKWPILADWEALNVALDEVFIRVPNECHAVAGPELGGAILATAIGVVHRLPFLIVRRGDKPYGISRAVEGTYEAGDWVCLVEDVLTSGQTALRAVRALRDAGLVVDTVVCLVDRDEGATALLARHGVAVRRVYALADLLRVAAGTEE